MSPEELDAIDARANAATTGPWERGDVWQWAGVLPEMCGEGRCAMCNRCGDPVWIGQHDINGETMLAHKHRIPDPYAYDYWISNEHGLIVGPYDYETGGVIDPADTEFIVHARTDMPALVAEVRRLRDAADEIRKLHRPFRIYDECGHDHSEEEGEPIGWFVIDEVGPTCEDGYMYTICHKCCTAGSGLMSEECVDGHLHGPGAIYCDTVHILDSVLDRKEQA